MTIFENPPTVPAPPPGRYSHVARVELGATTMLYLSGQVPVDADGSLVGPDDMFAQSEHVMDQLEAILGAYGGTLADVIHIRTFVADMSRIAEYGASRVPRFTGPPPASTTVEVSSLFVPGALLEVEVVASVPTAGIPG